MDGPSWGSPRVSWALTLSPPLKAMLEPPGASPMAPAFQIWAQAKGTHIAGPEPLEGPKSD